MKKRKTKQRGPTQPKVRQMGTIYPPTDPIMSWKKHFPGRNGLCPCKSGLKFKHCCLPKIQSGEIKIMGSLE